MPAQGILRLSQSLTLQQSADEFMVHLNSVEQRRQRWNKLGLAGLYEGRHTRRPKKWTPEQRQVLGELARFEGGTVVALLRSLGRDQRRTTIGFKPSDEGSARIASCAIARLSKGPL